MSSDLLGRLKVALEAADCEALLVLAQSVSDPDVAPFIGSVHLHSPLLVAQPGRTPWLGYWTPMEREEATATGLSLLSPESLGIARWAKQGLSDEELTAEVVVQALALTGVLPGRLAIGGSPSMGVALQVTRRLQEVGWEVISARSLLRGVRKYKTSEQIDSICEASRGTVAAFRRVAEILAGSVERSSEVWFEGERLRVGRVREEIAVTLTRHGLTQPEGNIVAPGAQGGVPHTAGDNAAVLRCEESLVVDLYPKGRMFSDCTRTFCFGEPREALRTAHGLTLAALELAQRRCAPGVRAWDLQVEVCRFFEGQGFPTPLSSPGTERGYVHGLGHGVGFELHELPGFRESGGGEGEIEVGDVLTLEPGLYDPCPEGGEFGFGVRLEDTLVITAEGWTNTTDLPYALNAKEWSLE